MSSPLTGQNLAGITNVAGTASDAGGSGLNRVDVLLVHTSSTAEYWTGAVWTTVSTPLPNSTELGWSRNTTLPTGTDLPPGKYEVRAKAYDNAGNASGQVTRSFTIYDANDVAPPATSLIFPPAASNVATLPNIRGTASDASGVARVDVFLYRVVSGTTQIWNGSTWVANVWTALPGSDEVSWFRGTGLPSGANLPAGQYGVRLTVTDAAYRTATQDYSFNVGLSNDNFANALRIDGILMSVPANNAAATKETNEPNHGGNAGGRSLWYRWQAPATGTVGITSEVVGANPTYQTLIGVYTGTSLGALTPVASTPNSSLTFSAVAGTEYQIACDGFNGASGVENLALWYVPAPVVSFTSVVPGDKQITLNWANPSTPAGYLLYRTQDAPRFTYADQPITSLSGSATSFTDTGLRNGQPYFYTLRVNSGVSYSKFCEPKGGIPSAFSQAPLNLRVSGTPAGGNISPALQWDAVAGATGYRIYRRTSSTPLSAVADVAAGATTWTDSAQPASQIYYYAVSTLGSAGAESAASAEVSIGSTAPEAPAQVTATGAAFSNGIFVQWTPSAGATSYTVRQYASSTLQQTFSNVQVPFFLHSNPTTFAGQPISYAVVASNGAGNSAGTPSNIVYLASVLPKPTDLRAAPMATAVNLSWTSSGAGAAYQVLRATKSGGPYSQTGNNLTATSYTDSDIERGVTYFYVVRAINDFGTTPYSNEVNSALSGWRLNIEFPKIASDSVTLRLPSMPPGSTGFTLLRARQSGGVPAAPTSGLMAWYRSDSLTGLGSGEQIWNLVDSSGLGRNAISPGAINCPTYIIDAGAGRPAMHFDGVEDLLRPQGSFADFTQGLSIFAAINPDAGGSAAGEHLVDFSASFAGALTTEHIYAATNSSLSYIYGIRSSPDTEPAISTSSVLTPNDWQVVGSVQQPGTTTSSVSNYRNGVEIATGSLPVPANAERTLNGIGNWYTGTRPFKGDLAEVLIYNRSVSASERATIEGYLSRRYGVPPATTPALVWEPIAYNQAGNSIYVDSGLNASTTYWYKVIATGTPDIVGEPNIVSTLPVAPGVPGAPAFASITGSTLTVTPSPNTWPAGANYLKLQYRKAAGSDAQYKDYSLVRRIDGSADGTSVRDLEPDTLYRFRYVALGEGTSTEGPIAEVLTKVAASGGSGGLLGTYYDDWDFTNRVFSRIDSKVDFNWHDFGPRGNMSGDKFAVRWTGSIQPKYTETYNLWLTGYGASAGADNDARMWINGTEVLHSNFYDNPPATISMVANQKYVVQIDYFEDTGDASIALKWQSASQPLEVVPSDRLYAPSGTGTGLRAQYFNDRYYSQQMFSRTDPQVAFGWPNNVVSPGMKNRDFAVMWTGKVVPLYGTAANPENYTFTVDFNGGVQLYVNNTLIINKWVAEQGIDLQWFTPQTATGNIALRAGTQYDIKLLYRADANSIGAWTAAPRAILKWSSANQAPEAIPSHRLIPASTDSAAPTGLPQLAYAGRMTASTKNIDPYPAQPQGGINVTLTNTGTKKWFSPYVDASEVVGESPDPRGAVRFKYWYLNEDTKEWVFSNSEQFLDATVVPGGSWNRVITWPAFNKPGTKRVACQLVLWLPGQNEVDISPIYTFDFEIFDAISGTSPVVVNTATDEVTLRLPRLPEGATSFTLQKATGGAATLSSSIASSGRQVWMRADKVFAEEGTPVQTWKNFVGSTKATALAPDGLPITNTDKKLYDPRPTWTASGPGGRPAMRFDGQDDRMSSDIIRSGSGYSSFAVARAATTRDYRGMFMFWADANNGINYGAVAAPGDYITPLFSLTNDPTNPLLLSLQANRWNLGEAFWQPNASSGMSVWRDGQMLSSRNSNSNPLAAAPMWIGGYDNDANGVTHYNFKGDISEILVYNRVLTTTERQTVEKYLADKYSLSYLTPPTTWTNIATNIAGNILYKDTGLTADTEYWYRLVVNYPSGTKTGDPVMATTRSVLTAPVIPGGVASGVPSSTSILATMPGTLGSPLSGTTDYLKLQIKFPAQPDTEYADVPGYWGAGEQVLVDNLAPQTAYNFRVMAIGPGGQTPGLVIRTYTTLPLPPEAPEAPEITRIDRTALKLTMPPLSAGATSLRLEYKSPADTNFVTAVNTTPGSTGLDGGVELDVTGLIPETTYNFRAVAVNTGGETPGLVSSAKTAGLPPGVPAEPRFQNIHSTSVDVVSPTPPAGLLKLQGYSSGAPNEWWDVASGLGGGAVTPVTGLNPGETYTFRYVAYNDGGSTPGLEASITMLQPLYVWRAGSGIDCRGIRNPGSTDTFVRNQQIKMRAFLATDWDARDTHETGGTRTDRYTDACSYAWSCPAACVTAGGGFLVNGVKVATYTGPTPIFVVPNNLTAYTVTLVVDDQGGLNIGNGDLGAREDANLGYNDDPLRFQMIIQASA